MSSYVDSSNLRQTSETTSNTMFSFDQGPSLSGRTSSRYGGVNASGMFTCPVPATSVEREEMKTSLRGNADTAPPLGAQIAMLAGGTSADASGLGRGGNAPPGRGADREPERSAKSGGDKSQQEGERSAERAQAAKRNQNAGQRHDGEPRPQIYPWMTKLHMSHGKVLPDF